MKQLYKNEREDTHRKKKEGLKSRHLLEDVTHTDLIPHSNISVLPANGPGFIL